MESSRPRALIVDFGGVLTTSIWPAFDEFCRAEGLPDGTIRRLFRDDPRALADLRELETGTCEPEEFERRFAAHLGIPDRAQGLIERLFAGLAPDEKMIAAVRRSRETGIRTGLISNSWGDGLAYDRAMLDELFHAVVISGDVGLHKPDEAIFRLGAERLGVPPEECVFVDDLRENCAGAEAVGMTAILHRGADSTLPELERLLGI